MHLVEFPLSYILTSWGIHVVISSSCSFHCSLFILQRFQKCEYAQTKLFKTDGYGWGLLADEQIKVIFLTICYRSYLIRHLIIFIKRDRLTFFVIKVHYNFDLKNLNMKKILNSISKIFRFIFKIYSNSLLNGYIHIKNKFICGFPIEAENRHD